MRYINRYILVFILIFFVSYSADANEVMRGTCIRVLDGDTVDIVSDGEHELFRVRLWGIDAPETSQPYGFAARRALAGVILGKDVQVRILSVDLYGRCVGEVFQNSQNVNEYMLRLGLAWYYERYARNETRFRQDEASARVHRKGLWAGVQPEAPWNYRRRVRSGGKQMIVTPLVMAAIRGHVEVVKYLIDAGADADGVGGKLALLAAIRNNQVDVVRCLLENGVDVRTDNAVYNHDCTESAGEAQSNETVTGHCIRVPDGDSIDVRLESGNLVRVHLWGVDAPELIQAHGAEAHQFLTGVLAGEEVKVLVSGTDDNGGYVGRVYKGDECVNLQVLAHGWGWLNVQHGGSKPEYARACHDACNRNCGLWAESGAVNPQEVRGQDVLVNPAGSVALSLSVAVGNEEIIDMLRQHGAELTDVVSRLPMAYAARNSRPEFVRALANHGAPINGRVNVAGVGRRALPRSNEQSTPLHNDNRRQFSVISENFPDNVSHGIRDEVYGLGYPESTIPAIHEDDSVSADEELLVSVYNGDLERIKAFVEGGGDINAAVDVYSSSVLRHCLSNMQFLENEADRELVLGTTPIIEAAKRGNSEVVRVLVSNGANVEVKDAFNTTATQYAEEKGRRDIVQELRRVSSASTRVSTANSSTQPSYIVPGGTFIPNPATTPSPSTVANGSPRPSPTSSVERTSAPLFEPTINRTSTTSRTSVPRSQPRRSSGRTYSSGGYSRQGDSYFRKNIEPILVRTGVFVFFVVLVILVFFCIVEDLFLMAAKRKTTIFARLFFLFGLKYNPKDTSRGFSPLCVAVSCNNLKLVKFLLKKGANPNFCTKWEVGSMPTAVLRNNLELVKYLEEKRRKRNYVPHWEFYPTQIAVICNNFELVKLLLEKGADPNVCSEAVDYPIQIAVSCSNLELIKLLLEKGANPNISTKWTVYPLQAAVASNNHELVKLLLAKGADPNICTANGIYLIQSAVTSNNYVLVKLLLENGADPNVCTERGDYPIQTAVTSNNHELVKLLLEKGANPNIRTKTQDYLIQIAVKCAEMNVLSSLIERGADITVLDYRGYNLYEIACLKNRFDIAEWLESIGISTQDITIFFARVVSCETKNLQLIDYLLLKGDICFEYIESSSNSTLYSALRSRNLKLVELLINKGANIEYMLCCLDNAIQSQENKIAEFLIINGANVFYRPFGSTTLLNKACKKGMPRVAELIREKGGKMYSKEQDEYCRQRGIDFSSAKPLRKIEKIDFSLFH